MAAEVTRGGASAVVDVSIDGKPVSMGYDHEFLFVVRGHHKQADAIATKAYVRVPLTLVLNASFVLDSDGGSLLVRLLSPPVQANGSEISGPFSFFKKEKSPPKCMEPLSQQAYDALTPTQQSERLHEQLEGPCSGLRLVKIEARVVAAKDGADVEAKTQRWVDLVMSRAYRHVKPYKRVKVLINPAGGPGKGRQLFESRARPILEAAGCKLDVTITTHRMHGLEIARDLKVQDYDAVGIVSGDGLLHEMLNGFATRPDASQALTLPLAPIPAGSGNAMSINLLGAQQGFSLALACLNIIKGRPMKLDLLSITQPASAFPPGVPVPGRPLTGSLGKRGARAKREATLNGSLSQSGRGSKDVAALIDAPSKPFVQYYSFLSQAIGILADLDLGTEHLRALGDTRFAIGYATSVIRNAKCEVDVDIKLGTRGTKNRAEMRQRVVDFYQASSSPVIDQNGTAEPESQASASASASQGLVHGDVTEPLTSDSNPPPPFDMSDPSWPHSLLSQPSSARQIGTALEGSHGDEESSRSGWVRIQEPIASLYGGKLPYVSRDMMQFPFALPNDGTIDVAMILHAGGRVAKVPENGYAENGQIVYQKAMTYLKVEAIRVTPKRKEGDKKLKMGGLISIDGEKVPYAPFQVEIAQGLQYSALSLYGRFCVPVVEPPATA